MPEETPTPEAQRKETCFIIMPENNHTNLLFQLGIQPAATEWGMECLRDSAGAGNQVGHIVKNIKKAKIVIVDLTGAKREVLYELGIAHGMLQNVIMIAKDKSDLPFDLINYEVIDYSEIETDTLKTSQTVKEKIIHSLETLDDWRENANPIFIHIPREQRPVPREDYQKLKDELDSAMKKAAELDEIREDVRRSQEQLAAKMNELNTTNQEIADARNQLQKAEAEIEAYRKKDQAYEEQKAEIDKLKKELYKLQGGNEFSQAFINQFFGGKAHGRSMEEMLQAWNREMDEKGEVIVDMPEKKRKFKFTKLSDAQKVKIPRRE